MALRAAVLAVIGIALLLYVVNAKAEPTHRTTVEGVIITLPSEKCGLPEVSILQRRATWVENGKTFEGCFGYVEALQILMFYFRDDKTVAVVPAGVFVRVTNI
jgi:hypothetical protein